MTIARTLVPEDFYDPINRDIFVAEKALILEYGTGDFVSICEAMKTHDKIEQLGGAAYLAELCILPGIESPTPGVVRTLKHRRAERDIQAESQKFHTLEAKHVPAHLMNLSKEIGQLLPTEEGAQKDRIAEAIKEGSSFTSTGIRQLDDILGGGFKDGALYTFAGRPGDGKSTLLTSFAAHLMNEEIPFAFLSLEMTEDEVMTKILQAMFGNTAEEIQADIGGIMGPLDEKLFHILDSAFTLEKITTEILCTDAPVIFIDYIQLIRDPSAGNKLAEVTNITRTLKLLAMEVKKPIVTASQMSREITKDNTSKKAKGTPVFKREPVLSDLRESGSIEQDCNVVGFLWKPNPTEEAIQTLGFEDAVAEVEGDQGPIDILIKKNRGGRLDTAKLYFDKPGSKIYEKI